MLNIIVEMNNSTVGLDNEVGEIPKSRAKWQRFFLNGKDEIIRVEQKGVYSCEYSKQNLFSYYELLYYFPYKSQ